MWSGGVDSILEGEKALKKVQDLDVGESPHRGQRYDPGVYLLSYLEAFHERYPNIKVIVSNAPTPKTMASLCQGKIDFGVVTTPAEFLRRWT